MKTYSLLGRNTLSLLLSLLLVFGLFAVLPMTSNAGEESDKQLYVVDAGTGVTVGESDDVKLSGDGWSWVQDTKTLTLNNFNLVVEEGVGIGIGKNLGTVNIILTGKNTIKSSGSGIHTASSIIISGNGSLDISTNGNCISTTNVLGSPKPSIEVSSGTVTAEGENGIVFSEENAGSGNFTLSGGNLSVTGKSSDGKGIYLQGSLTISSGTLNAKGVERGIDSGDVTISGGTVEATGTAGFSMYSSGKTDITGGTVIAKGGQIGILSIREMTIGDTADVTASGGNVDLLGAASIEIKPTAKFNGASVSAATDELMNVANKINFNSWYLSCYSRQSYYFNENYFIAKPSGNEVVVENHGTGIVDPKKSYPVLALDIPKGVVVRWGGVLEREIPDNYSAIITLSGEGIFKVENGGKISKEGDEVKASAAGDDKYAIALDPANTSLIIEPEATVSSVNATLHDVKFTSATDGLKVAATYNGNVPVLTGSKIAGPHPLEITVVEPAKDAVHEWSGTGLLTKVANGNSLSFQKLTGHIDVSVKALTAEAEADKTALKKTLDEVEGITHGGVYQTLIWTEFDKARTDGFAVYEDSAASQSQVDTAHTSLKTARDKLILTGNSYFENNIFRHTIGTTDTITHIVPYDWAIHTGVVKVDGQPLTLGTHHTSAEGSTRTTLLAPYLDTLSVGKHTLTVEFSSGLAPVSDTIEILAADSAGKDKNKKEASPKSPAAGKTGSSSSKSTASQATTTSAASPATGDTMPLALLLTLCAVALAALSLLLVTRTGRKLQ
jgi:hypothetical protein